MIKYLLWLELGKLLFILYSKKLLNIRSIIISYRNINRHNVLIISWRLIQNTKSYTLSKNPEPEGVYTRSMNTCAWLTGTWTQDNVYYFGEVCLIIHNILFGRFPNSITFSYSYSKIERFRNEYSKCILNK